MKYTIKKFPEGWAILNEAKEAHRVSYATVDRAQAAIVKMNKGLICFSARKIDADTRPYRHRNTTRRSVKEAA